MSTNARHKTKALRWMIVVISLWSLVLSLFPAGCAKQQRYETIEQIYVPDMDKAEVMQIAEDVLAKMHFTIDKADSESGVIKTRPLPGAQFFEFWRSDNVGAFNVAEANLHSIRRIAQVDINSQDGKGSQPRKMAAGVPKLYIGCDVQVQRLSLPAPHQLSQTPDQLTQTTGAEWIDLGKDTRLATEILKRIEKRIVPVSQTSHGSRGTRDRK